MRARLAASVSCLFAALALAAEPGGEVRLMPADVDALQEHEAGAGTSGVPGIRTTVVQGDPTRAVPYTIRLNVPAHTRIQAHSHRDNRTAVVVAGTWYFGYGGVARSESAKALPPGSFYTEPAGIAHFAETKDDAVVVYITGIGPTDTVFVKPTGTP